MTDVIHKAYGLLNISRTVKEKLIKLYDSEHGKIDYSPIHVIYG